MVNGKTIDPHVFALGCVEAQNRYKELIDVLSQMPRMSIENNAKYADLVVRTYGSDTEFVTQQLNKLSSRGLPRDQITASVIGAMAFFALNAPSEYLRTTARSLYMELLIIINK